MKTYRNLYRHIWDWDNLWLAYRRAARGKRRRAAAARFEFHLEDHLTALRAELRDKTYCPGPYSNFYIHEPKRRLISAAPFRDRVVHHALCNVIEPIFERRFIHDSYANRKGKGTHRALDRCQQFAQKCRYVLQCDVRQFFPSIDHAILKATLGRRIADADVMWLVDRILDSGVGVLARAYDMVYFPGDDPSTGPWSFGPGTKGSGQGLFAALRPRGLPIGNLTSQFWANCYLDPLDGFIKRELKCRHYLRYVDDFLLFADDKWQLHEWQVAVTEYAAGLRLTLHERRMHPRPVTEGIPFLGFVLFPTHRRLKRRKGIAFRRRFKMLARAYATGQASLEQVEASVLGWINHVRYADTWGLRRALFEEIPLHANRQR